jgi:hypothetical protein
MKSILRNPADINPMNSFILTIPPVKTTQKINKKELIFMTHPEIIQDGLFMPFYYGIIYS